MRLIPIRPCHLLCEEAYSQSALDPSSCSARVNQQDKTLTSDRHDQRQDLGRTLDRVVRSNRYGKAFLARALEQFHEQS